MTVQLQFASWDVDVLQGPRFDIGTGTPVEPPPGMFVAEYLSPCDGVTIPTLLGPMPEAPSAINEFIDHLEASRRPYVLTIFSGMSEEWAADVGVFFDGYQRLERPVRDGVVVMTVSAWHRLLGSMNNPITGGFIQQWNVNRAVVDFYEAPRPITELARCWASRIKDMP